MPAPLQAIPIAKVKYWDQTIPLFTKSEYPDGRKASTQGRQLRLALHHRLSDCCTGDEGGRRRFPRKAFRRRAPPLRNRGGAGASPRAARQRAAADAVERIAPRSPREREVLDGLVGTAPFA